MSALPTNVRVAAEEKSPQSGSRLEETEGRRTRKDLDLLAGASLTQKTIAGIQTSKPGHTLTPAVKHQLATRLAMISNLCPLREQSAQYTPAI
jgi:hypothetical protein